MYKKLYNIFCILLAKFFFTCFVRNMIPLTQINQTVRNIPQSVKNSEFPLGKINPADIEGIQKGIPLFDDGDCFVPMSDIDFVTHGLETVDLFRDCDLGCTHCLKNAVPNSKNNRSILFEDLTRFTEGFKTLNERLGFNTLNGNKYINIIDDSNPTDYPIKGLTRDHSVAESVRLIYGNLGIPVLFVTSGWNPKSESAQKSAEELAKEFTQNPKCLKSFEVSINPFMGIMENSRRAKLSGDTERADMYREMYTDRMANTILTFFDLFKGEEPKGKLIYRHANNFDGNELVGEKETGKLYSEIYEKLKNELGEKIEEAPILKPEKVTKFDKSHLIEPSGRGRQYFPYGYNMNLQSELISETSKWDAMTADEKRKFLRDSSIKCVDINGKVYSTFPAVGVRYENSPIELTVPTDVKLNYLNKSKTSPVFSDIEL